MRDLFFSFSLLRPNEDIHSGKRKGAEEIKGTDETDETGLEITHTHTPTKKTKKELDI